MRILDNGVKVIQYSEFNPLTVEQRLEAIKGYNYFVFAHDNIYMHKNTGTTSKTDKVHYIEEDGTLRLLH